MSAQATLPTTRRRWWAFGRPRAGYSERAREQLAAYLFILPWIIGFLIFNAGAMIYSLRLSFLETDLLSMSKFVGLENYQDLLSDKLFLKSLSVTTIYTLLTVIPGTILALGIAMLLNQKVRGMSIWRTVYYLPSVVSGIAVAIIWSWVLQADYGLVNTALRAVGIPGPRWFASEQWAIVGLALMALWGTGGNMLLFLAGLQSIPTELLEAAEIDGAGPWSKFRHVTIPLLTPTIFFSVVIGIIYSYQVFTSAYVVTNGGPNNATMTIVLFLYRQAFQLFQFGYASAVAWALFLIILVFTLMLIGSSKHWVHYQGGERG
jgi:multiple sugar transport system permease protein